MQRALFTGVAAAVMLFVALGPARAAGVTTRTAPYDFGALCFERSASFAVPPLGQGTPSGCTTVPDPAAQLGRLNTRADNAFATAAVIHQGFPRGGVARATAGPSSASTGLNINSGGGGRLTASAIIDGVTSATRVCMTIGWSGYPPQVSSCRGASPVATLDMTPNTTYTIVVTLYAPAATTATLGLPCPPSGFLTCTGSAAWTAADDQVSVRSIEYSIG